ncbi:hypothetical protein P3T76_006586 [Phytophthora citrophthora]|uniref:Uncharacterized protein n=1 Tax=Phytophthora citrophthora TaxID=4793 RepID=A0AAD9LPM2_9STRA|nr:hypothetical protein P3T76_006586 [Phytophthora citrophthora]
MTLQSKPENDSAPSDGAQVTTSIPVKSEAIAIRPNGTLHPTTDDMAVFSASPPFQANPCELLSTSPGYAYSKSQLKSSSSNVPTFITTDQFQLGLHGAKRSTSAGLISARKRGFSPDFGDSGVTVWGVSPDTPDAFGLAVVDGAGSASGGRPRFLSLSGSADIGGGSSDSLGNDPDADGTDMMLPFAIGDASTTRSSTTMPKMLSIRFIACNHDWY